jgi:two-component system cell cycle sensor histidine kinase/response regulator CckA
MPSTSSVRSPSSRVRPLLSWLQTRIPEGHPLAEAVWWRRHRGILMLLWAHVVGLAAFGILAGSDPLHALLESGVVAGMALLAGVTRWGRRFAEIMACVGLVSSSALLVHFSGGYIEMHFHFFVMVGVMALYQDWVPFLFAIGYVVVHHGLVGVLDPMSVFNHEAAWTHPWRWAAIHGVFILGMSVVSLIAWRLAEAAHARGELILNSAGDGIIGVDEHGRTTFANAAAAAMTGWDVEELLDRPLHTLLLAADQDAPWRSAASLTEAEVAGEMVFRRKNGATFPVDYISTPIEKGGNVAGAVVVFNDITRRKRAEAEVRESERRYRLLAENVSDVIWVRDMNLAPVYISPSVSRLRGYTTEEAMTQGLAETLTPASMAVAVKALGNTLALEGQGEAGPDLSLTLDLETLCKDGSTVWTETTMTFMRDPDGRAAGIVGVSRNITERKRAAEALRESEMRFRSVTDSAADAIIAADADGTIVSWNHGAEAIFGYTEGEIVGRPLTTLMPERYREAHRRGLARANSADRSVVGRNLEFSGVRKDGTEFPLELTLGSWESEQGRFYGGIIRDVTERKRAEEALRQTEQQLRQAQKMEAVGQLAGGIAHDFNNLLTVILGRSDLMGRRLQAGTPLHRDVTLIAATAARAGALTRQLLAFSRNQVLQPKVLDLNAVVGGMVTLLRRLIGEHIRLVTVFQPDLGAVRADPTQIEQVIVNLVVNARDAMPAGGTLTIETADARIDDAAADPEPSVGPGPLVSLIVRDTGCGMDANVQAHLFEPFFTTKAPGKGTGLGLATVYGIVKQHNGAIFAESAPEQGTTFRIYLPRATPDVVDETEDPPALKPGSETILLVEDEVEVRHLADEILRGHGYTVLAAGPDEALSLGARHPGVIQLLLTDVVMPGTNGRELADRLTRLRPETKVLFMSGYTDEAIVHHGVLNDHGRLLAKPFRAEDLLRKVREVLDR